MSKKFPILLGSEEEYELSESALNHIVNGDTVVRPIIVDGRKTTEPALSGGLHTLSAWQVISSKYPKIVHLLEYNSEEHKDWFYARELQNGVITLKLPRSIFTGAGAKITMQPDNYYKSGYLWKTLYPECFSNGDIINSIAEALENIDREDSTFPTDEQPMGVLYGYALLEDPLKTLKLRVQIKGNKIISAFPSWEQPFTGNNGKPYSHTNSINFNIAESTVNFLEHYKTWGRAFPKGYFNMDSFLDITPDFILYRTKRDINIGIESWRDTREKTLIDIGNSITEEEAKAVEIYLHDYVCSKDPFGIQINIYKNFLKDIKENDGIFNAAQLLENIAECTQVLTHYDLKNQTRKSLDFIFKFMNMAVVHTGGLCSLLFKRVLGEFIEVALGHHDNGSRSEFFEALASSPSRAALYTEFDLSPFIKENNDMWLGLAGLPKVDVELKSEHLFSYLALNLGENYLMSFSKEQRLAIAKSCFSETPIKLMLSHSMSFLSGADFQFFMPVRLPLEMLTSKEPPVEKDLIAVLRDYSRILVLYRQRIVLEDIESYSAKLDYAKYGSEEFFALIKQKHKRDFVWMMHNVMLNDMHKLAKKLKYEKLEGKVKETKRVLPKEVIPMPKAIPEYIVNRKDWIKKPTEDVDNKNLVTLILGG